VLSTIATAWEPTKIHKPIPNPEDPMSDFGGAQLIVDKTVDLDGTNTNICLKGTPIEFGRASNYLGRKQTIVSSKGYILAFEHEPPYSIKVDQLLPQHQYYASMPATMRNKPPGEKHNFPFLIIGTLGKSGKEGVSPKEVDKWASEYFQRWEYIVVDTWGLSSTTKDQITRVSPDNKDLRPGSINEQEFAEWKQKESARIDAAMTRLIHLANTVDDKEIDIKQFPPPPRRIPGPPPTPKKQVQKKSTQKTSVFQSFLNLLSWSPTRVSAAA